MREILCISYSELTAIKLSVNAYLALLMLKYGNLRYKITGEDKQELIARGFIDSSDTLREKAIKYFNNTELFDKFYNTFPHIVPVDFGHSRPLRAASLNTNAAQLTKVKWRKKTRGSIFLQNKIIEVLKAEIRWREEGDSLKYMNNIDTWLNQNNWEKYEYLLETDSSIDMSTDL